MIPPFTDDGYLPPGIFPANLEEIAERFGLQSEMRQAQMESLRWLVNLAKRIQAERLIINGSFVTDVLEPNDVDCVLLIGAARTKDKEAEAELVRGLPFLDTKLVRRRAFGVFVKDIFASDRHRNPKGMIEVQL
jgi:hypothetical protein